MFAVALFAPVGVGDPVAGGGQSERQPGIGGEPVPGGEQPADCFLGDVFGGGVVQPAGQRCAFDYGDYLL